MKLGTFNVVERGVIGGVVDGDFKHRKIEVLTIAVLEESLLQLGRV